LTQNYPNPFNPHTSIQYDLPRAARVRLEIFNLLGQRVRTLLDEVKPAGTHRVEWDGLSSEGRHAASGIYFLRLTAEDFIATKKMILLK
jgi:flagellar hook assembly protein FlgD